MMRYVDGVGHPQLFRIKSVRYDSEENPYYGIRFLTSKYESYHQEDIQVHELFFEANNARRIASLNSEEHQLIRILFDD